MVLIEPKIPKKSPYVSASGLVGPDLAFIHLRHIKAVCVCSYNTVNRSLAHACLVHG